MPYELDVKSVLHPNFPHTKRWTPTVERAGIGLSGERLRFYYSTAYEQILPNGRQSLKTELTRRKIVQHLPVKKEWDDPRYFMAAPTFNQVKRINWRKFVNLVPDHWIEKIYKTDLCIRTKFGSELWLVGLDKPQRIEGDSWDGGAMDEFSDTKPSALDEHIRPSLAARDGWLILLGTPDFKGVNAVEYRKLCDEAVELKANGNNDDIDIFIWPSDEVLNAKGEARLLKNMSALIKDQELGGNCWINMPGLAYPLYNADVHKKLKIPLVLDGTPILVVCDFNYGHHNWLICQCINKIYYICRQVYLTDADVSRMIPELRRKLADIPSVYFTKDGLIQFYGDYSGDAHKADAPKSVWQQIKDAFPNGPTFGYRLQGPVVTRIEAVNKGLESGDGKVSVYISEECEELIKDFASVTRKQLLEQVGKGGARTHASDDLGYLLVQHGKRSAMMDIDLNQIGKMIG